MHYVYVLKSNQGALYVGRTCNLRSRLKAHNEGKNRSTRHRQWELVYYEAYKSQEDAIARENSLKHHGQAIRWLKQRIAKSLQSAGKVECWRSFEPKPQ